MTSPAAAASQASSSSGTTTSSTHTPADQGLDERVINIDEATRRCHRLKILQRVYMAPIQHAAASLALGKHQQMRARVGAEHCQQPVLSRLLQTGHLQVPRDAK